MFALKAGMLVCVASRAESDGTLNEAAQTVLPLEESVLMEWNGVTLSLNYKYDISVMLEDIVELVLAVEKTGTGSYQVDWPSSGFPFRWTVKWNESEVDVRADSRDEPGAVNLTGRERVRVERGSFVGAWKALLRAVLSCLEGAGYTSQQVHGLARLRTAAIGGSWPTATG
ncbi:hypothetical protein [Hyalangium rubrum]|uniref:Uncharacterized protein n=1 Tax=Hyalangium rubrum TaxID=3103134 RepID=A0ABU5H519_9BACT|nr:hypothetical protein [Hyalangium sp. s54d21]MDY7228591.1 hypothetical protein [Hyalangium sp. s54d21]